MKCVQVWLEDSQLTLNLNKNNYTIFQVIRKKYNKELKITLNEYEIKEVNMQR